MCSFVKSKEIFLVSNRARIPTRSFDSFSDTETRWFMHVDVKGKGVFVPDTHTQCNKQAHWTLGRLPP